MVVTIIEIYLAGYIHFQHGKPMARKGNQQRTRKPSVHQKRIRFLTGLSIFLIIAVTITLFLIENRASLATH